MKRTIILKEKWKALWFCNAKYQVSNHGRVKSVYGMNKYGKIELTGTILKPHVNDKGYAKIDLQWYDKGLFIKKKMAVHRLVGIAFLPNPQNKPEINHLDFNTVNNYIGNLEWATPKENTAHYIRSKKFKERQALRTYTLSQDDLDYINLHWRQIGITRMAELYNVSYNLIYKSVTHRRGSEKTSRKKLGMTPDCYKPIIDINTGVFYLSAKELGSLIGVAPKEIRRKLNGERPNTTQYRYA